MLEAFLLLFYIILLYFIIIFRIILEIFWNNFFKKIAHIPFHYIRWKLFWYYILKKLFILVYFLSTIINI